MSIDKYIETTNFGELAITDIKKPNLFQRAQAKLQGINGTIAELNRICKIEYAGNTVGFSPRINLEKFGEPKHAKIRLESREYVAGLLKKLGFSIDLDVDSDDTGFPNTSVYVNLKNSKNAKLMQRVGSKFGFYYKRPLQQRDLDKFMKGKEY